MKGLFHSQCSLVAMTVVTWFVTQPIIVHCQVDDFAECISSCGHIKIFYGRVWPPALMENYYTNCLSKCQPKETTSSPLTTTTTPRPTTPLPTTPVPTTPKPTTPVPTTPKPTTPVPTTPKPTTPVSTTPKPTTPVPTTPKPTTPVPTTPKPTTPVPTTPRPTTSVCGVKARNSLRIVGGSTAVKCEFPWIVALYLNDFGFSFRCGGSLIDRRHVITAAHCVRNRSTGNIFSPSVVTVGYGSSVRKNQDTVNVIRVLPHPLYNKTNSDYDVAVLTLAEDFIYDECVSPICLPDVDSDPKEADKCTAAGWGRTSYYTPGSPNILRKVDLPIVDQKLCKSNSSYGFFDIEYINDLKLCTGDFQEGGIGVCHGDSGGPLMCQTEGVFYLHGIASFTRRCATPRYPDVFTRVTHPEILDFIREGIKDIPRDS